MPRTDRRRFLEDSLLAAAAFFASASFAEADAKPEPTAPTKPNDKIHLGVIGLNGRGDAHIQGYLSQPDAVIAAVCDVYLPIANRRADEIEKKSGHWPKVYQDLRRLYEDREIDAVSMALPIHWHSLAAIWAMRAGKDVYVEKPVCHNVFEGGQLVKTARKYRRICQAGTQSRSNRAIREAIRFIHSGGIGEVRLARGLCYKPRGSIGVQPNGAPPEGLDYDLWLGPAPKRRFNPNRFLYNWHWNWDYGAGDLGNQGIHQMDIARWALKENDFPKAVLGLGGRFGYVDQGETPNTELAFFDYGEKSLLFEVRGLKTEPYLDVMIGDIVYGSEGYVAITGDYAKAAAFDPQGRVIAQFSGGGDHFRNFLDAVRRRDASLLHAPVHEGYLSSALCHLGNISYRLSAPRPFEDEAFVERAKDWTDREDAESAFERFGEHLADNGIDLKKETYRLGRPLAFDPRTHEFVGDREADSYLTRVYREPFVVRSTV